MAEFYIEDRVQLGHERCTSYCLRDGEISTEAFGCTNPLEKSKMLGFIVSLPFLKRGGREKSVLHQNIQEYVVTILYQVSTKTMAL